jgi:hypothetical protein
MSQLHATFDNGLHTRALLTATLAAMLARFMTQFATHMLPYRCARVYPHAETCQQD